MTSIFKNKKVEIWHSKELKLLFIEYTGVFNYELTLEAYSNINVANIEFIIGDLTQVRGSFNRLMESFDEKYIRLKGFGLIGQALIIPDDLIINNLVAKLKTKIESVDISCLVTNSKKEAFEWVKNQALIS